MKTHTDSSVVSSGRHKLDFEFVYRSKLSTTDGPGGSHTQYACAHSFKGVTSRSEVSNGGSEFTAGYSRSELRGESLRSYSPPTRLSPPSSPRRPLSPRRQPLPQQQTLLSQSVTMAAGRTSSVYTGVGSRTLSDRYVSRQESTYSGVRDGRSQAEVDREVERIIAKYATQSAHVTHTSSSYSGDSRSADSGYSSSTSRSSNYASSYLNSRSYQSSRSCLSSRSLDSYSWSDYVGSRGNRCRELHRENFSRAYSYVDTKRSGSRSSSYVSRTLRHSRSLDIADDAGYNPDYPVRSGTYESVAYPIESRTGTYENEDYPIEIISYEHEDCGHGQVCHDEDFEHQVHLKYTWQTGWVFYFTNAKLTLICSFMVLRIAPLITVLQLCFDDKLCFAFLQSSVRPKSPSFSPGSLSALADISAEQQTISELRYFIWTTNNA